MADRNELFGLYEQWRQLSESEAAAIQSAAWPRVQDCLNAKFQLQAQILISREGLDVEITSGRLNRSEFEASLRQVVGELIRLEAYNSELLAEQHKNAQTRTTELRDASRNLRQMRRAYTSPPSAHWHSYS
jgi:hypothetical protein